MLAAARWPGQAAEAVGAPAAHHQDKGAYHVPGTRYALPYSYTAGPSAASYHSPRCSLRAQCTPHRRL